MILSFTLYCILISYIVNKFLFKPIHPSAIKVIFYSIVYGQIDGLLYRQLHHVWQENHTFLETQQLATGMQEAKPSLPKL